MFANTNSTLQMQRLREVYGRPPKPWDKEQPSDMNPPKSTQEAVTNTSPPKPFKCQTLAAVNNKTRKCICKDCGKETLHKHRLRHARVCKKVPLKRSAEWQEQQDRSRGSCFFCHAEGHWAANCPVKKKRRYL